MGEGSDCGVPMCFVIERSKLRQTGVVGLDVQLWVKPCPFMQPISSSFSTNERALTHIPRCRTSR